MAGVFQKRKVDELSVRDERAFRGLPLYASLKEILRRDGYVFRVLPKSSSRWDRALMLNLTYWGGDGGDVLESDRIAADVVMHAAWHHLAALALGASERAPSAEALFFGESIASAFDAYLVGCLLGSATRSSFLETQVPAMGEAARAAGLSAGGFRALLEGMAMNPEASFEGMREMLYDAACGLVACRTAAQAHGVLVRSSRHRFGPLLHHYELSNWVLYARAYAKGRRAPDRRVGRLDGVLRSAPLPLSWLCSQWVAPALAARTHEKARRSSAKSAKLRAT